MLTPSSSDYSSTSFAFWLGCSSVGHWENQALCLLLVLTPLASYLQLELQLTQAVCGTCLYNCLTYTCFLWPYVSATITEFNHVHRSRWYSDIFDQMQLFRWSSAYLHRCISLLTAQSRVNMLYIYLYISIYIYIYIYVCVYVCAYYDILWWCETGNTPGTYNQWLANLYPYMWRHFELHWIQVRKFSPSNAKLFLLRKLILFFFLLLSGEWVRCGFWLNQPEIFEQQIPKKIDFWYYQQTPVPPSWGFLLLFQVYLLKEIESFIINIDSLHNVSRMHWYEQYSTVLVQLADL